MRHFGQPFLCLDYGKATAEQGILRWESKKNPVEPRVEEGVNFLGH